MKISKGFAHHLAAGNRDETIAGQRYAYGQRCAIVTADINSAVRQPKADIRQDYDVQVYENPFYLL